MVVDREKNILLSHRCSPVRHEYISKIRKLHPIHSRQVYTDSYVSCNDKIIADYGEHEGHTSLLHSTGYISGCSHPNECVCPCRDSDCSSNDTRLPEPPWRQTTN
ncbi:uncharacterized protein LOC110437076 isoform X5 [Sorghum bicolor]|uniref:uncharacterized protein LOC110437076 isoform X5 n=1 Tax=Sorghum bicolor TaxID=4558 RepID=UPI000B423ED7|nr:uncharacterized protein LOC110437076 isoform X5 [Sorghum bicolor]|eukprot:XP_021320912.1 uncharacterized protein LOC110437076 isoform X5 [Sorghum bicolor]